MAQGNERWRSRLPLRLLRMFRDDVPAGPEVPRLDDARVARLLQLSGDPLRPRPIRLVVADEEVFLRVFSAHVSPR